MEKGENMTNNLDDVKTVAEMVELVGDFGKVEVIHWNPLTLVVRWADGTKDTVQRACAHDEKETSSL
jgi:hypothetical protein